MKQTFKTILPRPAWELIRNSYDSLRRTPEVPSAFFHPWRRQSIRRLTALKDIHKGERIVIIGNGPSLRQTDLSRLKNEFTFG